MRRNRGGELIVALLALLALLFALLFAILLSSLTRPAPPATPTELAAVTVTQTVRG